MTKKDLRKQAWEYLRDRYNKCIVVSDRTTRFQKYCDELGKELERRQIGRIFYETTHNCKLKCPEGWNYFEYCSHFAQKLVREHLFPDWLDCEVAGRYTKSGNPYLIEFDW
jgi:hypothetical protein